MGFRRTELQREKKVERYSPPPNRNPIFKKNAPKKIISSSILPTSRRIVTERNNSTTNQILPPHRSIPSNPSTINVPAITPERSNSVQIAINNSLLEDEADQIIIGGGEGFDYEEEEETRKSYIDEVQVDSELLETNPFTSEGEVDLFYVGHMFKDCVNTEEKAYQRKRLTRNLTSKPVFSVDNLISRYDELDEASQMLASTVIGLTEALNRCFLKAPPKIVEGFEKMKSGIAKFVCPETFTFSTLCIHQNGHEVELETLARCFSRRNCKLTTIVSSFVKEAVFSLISDFATLTGSYSSNNGNITFPRQSVVIITEILTACVQVDHKTMIEWKYDGQLADTTSDYITGLIKRERVKALAKQKNSATGTISKESV